MTTGAQGGTGGERRWPSWTAAYAIILLATATIGTVNVLSLLDERDWMNRPLDWWRPAVWEGTSGVVLLSMAWIPLVLIRRFPLGGAHWRRNLAIHLMATLPFSLAHSGLMIALRHGAYALAGETYSFGGGWAGLLYEYRKDIITYALYAAAFWLAERLMRPLPPTEGAVSGPFVIDEGQRIIRVLPAEILSIRSSGNYAEFFLADGRQPLMRTTLARLEDELGGQGFLRTHRSWLVNKAHVLEIKAEGSGDHGLRLTDSSLVPLSRRYPEALRTLRGDG